MSAYRQTLGAWGEREAAKFLESKNFKILAHNFRARPDEIDLIATRAGKIHFVEVKTRTEKSAQNFGGPQAAITPRKQQSLIRAAYAYLLQQKLPNTTEWQIDVIAITKFPNDHVQIEHLPCAVEEN